MNIFSASSSEGEAVGDPGRLPGPLGGHGRLPVGPGTGAGGGGVAGGTGRDERRVADVDVEKVGGVTHEPDRRLLLRAAGQALVGGERPRLELALVGAGGAPGAGTGPGEPGEGGPGGIVEEFVGPHRGGAYRMPPPEGGPGPGHGERGPPMPAISFDGLLVVSAIALAAPLLTATVPG